MHQVNRPRLGGKLKLDSHHRRYRPSIDGEDPPKKKRKENWSKRHEGASEDSKRYSHSEGGCLKVKAPVGKARLPFTQNILHKRMLMKFQTSWMSPYYG